MNVQEYGTFVGSHKRFLLYVWPPLSWQQEKLREDGAVLRPVGEESWATVYEVTMP